MKIHIEKWKNSHTNIPRNCVNAVQYISRKYWSIRQQKETTKSKLSWASKLIYICNILSLSFMIDVILIVLETWLYFPCEWVHCVGVSGGSHEWDNPPLPKVSNATPHTKPPQPPPQAHPGSPNGNNITLKTIRALYSKVQGRYIQRIYTLCKNAIDGGSDEKQNLDFSISCVSPSLLTPPFPLTQLLGGCKTHVVGL